MEIEAVVVGGGSGIEEVENVLKPRERREGMATVWVEIKPAARELTGGVEQVVVVLQRIFCIVAFLPEHFFSR